MKADPLDNIKVLKLPLLAITDSTVTIYHATLFLLSHCLCGDNLRKTL